MATEFLRISEAALDWYRKAADAGHQAAKQVVQRAPDPTALATLVANARSQSCINQLKEIGIAFQTWALDNSAHFPFNVSTNSGGTMESVNRAAMASITMRRFTSW